MGHFARVSTNADGADSTYRRHATSVSHVVYNCLPQIGLLSSVSAEFSGASSMKCFSHCLELSDSVRDQSLGVLTVSTDVTDVAYRRLPISVGHVVHN